MKHLYLFLFITVSLLVCGCSSDDDDTDGDWTPMEWVASGDITMEDGAFIVGAQEQTVRFICKNYSSPWIASVHFIDGTLVTTEENNHLLKTDWFEASMSDNVLTVVLTKNNTGSERVVSFLVTAGDIFANIPIRQKYRDLTPIDRI